MLAFPVGRWLLHFNVGAVDRSQTLWHATLHRGGLDFAPSDQEVVVVLKNRFLVEA